MTMGAFIGCEEPVLELSCTIQYLVLLFHVYFVFLFFPFIKNYGDTLYT